MLLNLIKNRTLNYLQLRIAGHLFVINKDPQLLAIEPSITRNKGKTNSIATK